MQNTKIGDFFTPVQRNSKRPRAYVSPGSEDSTAMGEGDEKVGDMSLNQLMSGLSSLLESKLDEKLSKLASKDDILNISNKVEELVAENELLKKEIDILKRQGKIVCDKLVDLEGRSRRNNLIFKGLQWKGKQADFKEIVRKFCRDMLGCADRVWVNRAHPVGRDGKAIIAHIPEDSDISYILTQARKLKGTGYVIHRDFPQETRVKRSYLVAVRAEIDRVAGGLKMPLVHDHLYVKGRKFTWEAGKLKAGQVDGAQELQSLFRHDFTAFLTELSQKPRESPPRTTSLTYSQVTSQESPRPTSQEMTQAHAASQGTHQTGAAQNSTAPPGMG